MGYIILHRYNFRRTAKLLFLLKQREKQTKLRGICEETGGLRSVSTEIRIKENAIGFCKVSSTSSYLKKNNVHIFHVIYLEFKAGKTPILIATDVAARGLGRFCLV